MAAIVFHLLPLATRPALIGGDEPHYALAAHSLATSGDLDLANDYDAVEAGSPAAGEKRAGQALDRHLLEVGGREVFSHPVGLPLLTAPLLAGWRLVAGDAPPDLPLGLLTLGLTWAALVAGWRLLSDTTGSGHGAAWLVFAVYFASPLAFYSRTFFTEPYTWAFLVLAIAALCRDRPWRAALWLALAPAMKETALLLVGPIVLASWWIQGRSVALRAATGPLLFGIFFVGKNLLLVGQPLATFQPFQWGNPLDGLVGLLLGPERGLLCFAPLLLLALAGFALPRRSEEPPGLGACAALAFFGYLAISACWVDWRGGTSYGTRLLLPALPALVIPLRRWQERLSVRLGTWLLGGLASLGFAVALSAAVDPVPAFWGASIFELVGGQPVAFVAGLVIASVVQWRAAGSGFRPSL